MKILVINSASRPGGNTTELAQAFMEGVRAQNADVDMVMLRDKNIRYCANCLHCYGFTGDGLAPCRIQDDMDEIIQRVIDADGVLFASPVHNGFVSGLMTVFWERLSWRVARPGDPVLQFMSIQSRIQNKVRAFGSIVTAGGMPLRFRSFCDDGTPWLKSNAPLLLHGQWIGDLYAAADLERRPENAQDWRRIYFLRRVGADQRRQAYDLGKKMVTAIRSGRLVPVTIEKMMNPLLLRVMEWFSAICPPYRVVKE